MSREAIRCTIASMTLAVLAMVCARPAGAAPKVLYTRISVPQNGGQTAVAYLSIENNKLRAATTIEGLASAAVVKAKDSHLESLGWGEYYQNYTFPEVELPLSIVGYDRISVTPTYSRSGTKARGSKPEREDWQSVSGELVLSRKDKHGITWGYSLSLSSSHRGKPQYSKEHPYDLTAPKLANDPLTFEITAQVEKRDARIGLQIKSGKTGLRTVIKDGKGTPVKLEVLDKDRKVVASETGDPIKFGFT